MRLSCIIADRDCAAIAAEFALVAVSVNASFDDSLDAAAALARGMVIQASNNRQTTNTAANHRQTSLAKGRALLPEFSMTR